LTQIQSGGLYLGQGAQTRLRTSGHGQADTEFILNSITACALQHLSKYVFK